MKWGIGAAVGVFALLAASQAGAVRTSLWTQDEVMDFLYGDGNGVTVTSDAQLVLGATLDSVATNLSGVNQIWCLARDSKGRVYFGTGDNGRIYRYTKERGAQLLWETGASEITSMVVDASDDLYAGSAPGGTVFRVGAQGDTSRYFQTGEESIWSLLLGKGGVLYAGTGSKGRIFRITGPNKGTVFAETRDANVMALAEAKDGSILAGTASKGLLLRVDSGGSARVIYDSGMEEVRAIAVLEDGSIAVGTNRGRSATPSGPPSGGAASPYAIDVTPGGRDGGGTGKCGVYLVQPDGSARLLYAPPCDFVYAMLSADARSVLVSTADPAAIFRVGVDRKYEVLGALESKQILALLRSGGETYAATGNAAVLYALGSGPGSEGIYISEPHDLRSVATWGEARVRLDGSGEVLWASRSGFSKTPDDGWSAWSREVPMQGGVKIESPPARFLQYRLRFRRGSGGGPVVSTVDVAYMQRNLPPSIAAIALYGPANPYFEGGPEYRPPQISQTYTNGMKIEFGLPRSGPRQISDASAAWARGIRSASWDANDPNGDNLSYSLYIKADDEKEWRPLAEDLDDKAYSWDSESYANGTYRLKLQATDAPDNPEDAALKTERLSPPFQIDNLSPRVEGLAASAGAGKTKGKSAVTVSGATVDADSRIARIEYSIDGSDWSQVFPQDGIFDSKDERFRFEIQDVAPGEHVITVRASDAERNVSVGRVLTVTR